MKKVAEFFDMKEKAEGIEDAETILSRMRACRVTGMLLNVLTKEFDKVSRRRQCQHLLKMQQQENLTIRSCILERAKKAVTLGV